MKNEVGLRCVPLYKFSDLTIKIGQKSDVVGEPRLVNRFVSNKSWVRSKFLENSLGLCDTPLDISIVELSILLGCWVELARPERLSNILEIVLVNPRCSLPNTSIIKTIL